VARGLIALASYQMNDPLAAWSAPQHNGEKRGGYCDGHIIGDFLRFRCGA
jgi:hypothetical protein